MAKTYFATQEWVKEQIASEIVVIKEFGGYFDVKPGTVTGSPSGVTYNTVETTVNLSLPRETSKIANITLNTTPTISSVTKQVILTEPGKESSLYDEYVFVKFTYISGGLMITVRNTRPSTFTVDYTVRY